MATPETPTVSPTVLKYAKTLFSPQTTNYDERTSPTAPSAQVATDLNAFLKHLFTEASDAQGPEAPDTSHPLSHYFISSSHNTYLSGNQLYGKASITPYQHVLEHGCRCVEIDVWNGEAAAEAAGGGEDHHVKSLRQRLDRDFSNWRHQGADSTRETEDQIKAKIHSTGADTTTDETHDAGYRDEPRVLHGHTATREVPFRKVCMAIRDYAFKTSDQPIIVSLEVHTNAEQQQKMVDIMHETWASHLVENVKMDDHTQLPTLSSLQRKILIKVKYSAAPSEKPKSHAQGSVENSSEDEALVESVKKGKIIQALGSMGVYTRSCHFKGFDRPEAKLPTHVFALSESKLISVHADDPEGLFQHNKHFLMRAYPKGLRVSSSNLDPAPCWRQGVQMVALNWQSTDAATMLNHAMFDRTNGWVLKPEGYRETDPSSIRMSKIRRGTLDLSVEVFAGQSVGDPNNKVHPYIRCELHVEGPEEGHADAVSQDGQVKGGGIKVRSSVASGHSEPDFHGQSLLFKQVRKATEELSFLRLKIMDDDPLRRDELIAWACIRVCRLQAGVRLIHLYDAEGQPTRGVLLVRIKKSFVPE